MKVVKGMTCQFPFKDEIILHIMDRKKLIMQIASFLTDNDINKETFNKICKKYDVEIFTSDKISYKAEKVASKLSGKEFVDYARSFYDKTKYVEYPIFEVFNHLEESPFLVNDIVAYLYSIFNQSVYYNRNLTVEIKKSHQVPYDVANPRSILEIPESRRLFSSGSQDYKLRKMDTLENKMKLLSLSAKFLNQDYLKKIVPLYSCEVKVKVLTELINKGESNTLKKLVRVDNILDEEYRNLKNYQFNRFKSTKYRSIDRVLSELIKNKTMVKEVASDLNRKSLDELLNKHCEDNDFEMIAFLIDQGGYLYSSNTIQQDDGWGYMEDVTEMARDKKKTAVMREMIRNFSK